MIINKKLKSVALESAALVLFLILVSSTASAATTTSNVVGTNYQYWSSEQYPLIDLFGDNYVPLCANTDPIWKSHVGRFAKLVIDSKGSHNLMTGENLDLGQGYRLQVMQVDVDGEKVWLELDKDEQYVDDQIISTDSGDNTWTCTLDNIEGVNNVPVLKVHVNQVFQGSTDSIAQIDGIWLIDYASAKSLQIGDKFGDYTLTTIINGVDASNLESLVFESVNDQPINVGTYAYISNSGSSNVSVIDTATDTVIATVNVGSDPHGVAVSPDGLNVYVANAGSDSVSVIDTATNTVKDTVIVEDCPRGVAVSPDGTKVYVTNSGSYDDPRNTVSVIDASINKVISTVNVGNSPFGIDISSSGKKVYVANYLSNTVSVIDTATDTVTSTVNVGENPQGVAVTPDGSKVYVANFWSHNVSVIDTATNTVKDTVIVEDWPYGVAVSPDGKKVYVGYGGPHAAMVNSIQVIDTATNTVTTEIKAGQNPQGVAVTPDGKKVYTVNYFSNSVSVIDAATNTATGTIKVGSFPHTFGKFIGSVPTPEPVYPIADFSATPTFGIAPLTVTFADKSTGSPTSWYWKFGYRVISTAQNPEHIYSKAGKYTVSLTVKNSVGSDTRKISKYIIVKK